MYLLSTDSLKGYGLNRIFSFAKRSGFDGIDLVVDPGYFDTFNTVYLKKLTEKFGLPIVSIQAPEKTSKHAILKTVQIAKDLDVGIVVIQPPKIFQFTLAAWIRMEIPRIRKRESISIALQNASGKTLLGFIPEYGMNNLNELKRFKHASLDLSRLYQKKIDIMRAYNRLKTYLVHIHVSNVKHGKGHQLPNDGVLPLESFLTKLKQDKFPGVISLKVHPKFLEVGNDKKVKGNLTEALEYLQSYFGKGQKTANR